MRERDRLYWKDFRLGETSEMGRHTFTAAEIVEFARQFDPQSSHLDPVDSVRWLKPVRPGDTLAYRRTVLATRASTTRKGVGLVKHRWEAVNQAGELVLTMEAWGMFGRRPAA